MAHEKQKRGTIGWTDLTVPDADKVRDFYKQVVGWGAEPLDMGGYADYVMTAEDNQGVAGVCHARGENAGLPAQWLIYIIVDDMDASVAQVKKLGGKVLAGPKGMSGGRFAVIQDPAGAVCALFMPSRS